MRFCAFALPCSFLLHLPAKTKCSFYLAGSKSGSENGISVAKQEYWSVKSQWLLHVHARLAIKIIHSAQITLMCFVWLAEQTAIIFLHSFKWLVFVTEEECVYYSVRAQSLNTIPVICRLLLVFNLQHKLRINIPRPLFQVTAVTSLTFSSSASSSYCLYKMDERGHRGNFMDNNAFSLSKFSLVLPLLLLFYYISVSFI